MNHLRIDQLANHLDEFAHDDQFTMNEFVEFTNDGKLAVIRDLDNCGTAGCIAGWTVYLFGSDEDKSYWAVEGIAAHLLELTEAETRELFFRDRHHTRTQAVQKLRTWASNARRMESSNAKRI